MGPFPYGLPRQTSTATSSRSKRTPKQHFAMGATRLFRHFLLGLFVFELFDTNGANIAADPRWSQVPRSKSSNVRGIAKENVAPINFTDYQRLDNIHGYLVYLAQTYPNIVSVGIMGDTFEKRPIKYIKISSGIPNAKVVFIDGGIHAREWIAVSSVIYIIQQLVENRKELSEKLLKLDFYIVPVLNPDGYEYSHTKDRFWRKNRSGSGECLGVDLNRNFDIHFGLTGSSDDPCTEIYQGRGPHSELETIAVSNFLLSLKRRLKAYITFHSYGQYILVPYGYEDKARAPNFNEMMRVAHKASKAMKKIDSEIYLVGNTAELLYAASGASDDWVKAKIGTKYVYCIELRDTGDYGFDLPAEQIIPAAREAFEAVKVIGVAASGADFSLQFP